MKKILVTGAKGFVGRNLCAALQNVADGKDRSRGLDSDIEIMPFDIDTDPALLDKYCKDADFVFNLAGVNRPVDVKEFYEGNTDFSKNLLDTLAAKGNKAPIVVSSSIQALLDNDYGKSKKMGEDLFLENGNNPAFIARLYGVFGKWSRPNYNTVVATFMYNVAHGLPLQINDPDKELTLCYIDDVIAKFTSLKDKVMSIVQSIKNAWNSTKEKV